MTRAALIDRCVREAIRESWVGMVPYAIYGQTDWFREEIAEEVRARFRRYTARENTA